MKFPVTISMAVLFVLTACATPRELRQKVPDFDEVTNIPAERMAGCVGDKLEANAGDPNTRYSTRPTTNGFSVEGVSNMGGIYSGSTDTPVLVDITRQNDGKTLIQLWSNYPFPAGTRNVVSLVKACLQPTL